MPFNKNLCKNKFIKHKDKIIMLQAASMYTKGDGSKWEAIEMLGNIPYVVEAEIPTGSSLEEDKIRKRRIMEQTLREALINSAPPP